MRIERCALGSQVGLAFEQPPILLEVLGEMTAIEPRAEVVAFDAANRVLGSTATEPASDGTLTLVDLHGAAAVSVGLPWSQPLGSAPPRRDG